MKKLTGIIFVAALVLMLQTGVPSNANATGPFDDHVDYAPGYKYDSSKDPTYGVHSSDSSNGSLSGNSGSGGSRYTKEELMDKVTALRAELAKVSPSGRHLNDGLKYGSTNEEVKKVQELLASDPSIYPEGRVSGYYGDLTKEALKRFQKKHDLAVTGEVTTETKELLEGYLKVRSDAGSTAHGWLKNSSTINKVRDTVCEHSSQAVRSLSFCKETSNTPTSGSGCAFAALTARCHNGTSTSGIPTPDKCGSSRLAWCPNGTSTPGGSNPDTFCARAKFASHSAWSERCENFDVKVKILSGTTTVTFNISSTSHSVVVKSKVQADVLEAVADELDEDLEDVNPRLVKEIKKKFAETLRNGPNSSLGKRAQRAITRAEHDLATVASDIDEADSDVDTDEAEEVLDDAEELLEEAQDQFDNVQYKEARVTAREAEDLADEAADLLEEAIEDAE